MASLDCYDVLGVSRACTPADVKKAYRKLASQYHPDKVRALPPKLRSFADEEMRRINLAKETLLDPGKKVEHDKGLQNKDAGSAPRPAPPKRPVQQNKSFNFGCPHCSTKVSAVMIDRSYVILCPSCKKQMTIPAKKQGGGGNGLNRVAIYSDAMRRAMMDGVITPDESNILDGLRQSLGITPMEHQNVLFHVQVNNGTRSKASGPDF